MLPKPNFLTKIQMAHTLPEGVNERRSDPQRPYWDKLTPEQQALWVAKGRFDMQRPDDFDSQGFPGGDTTKKAVSGLLDRVEGRLDQEKIAQLKKGFDVSVGIWDDAGLFTPEREKAGYARPDFDAHYLPYVTQETLDLAESGEGLDKGYNMPSFAPMDVPVYSENSDALSYFKLLEQALTEAFHGTMGGKQPNTLLIGPDKHSIGTNQVNLEEILWKWEKYLKSTNFVFEPKAIDPKNHQGLSEQQLLESLTGVEKQTGGILRLERPSLIMPKDVGKEAMSGIDWDALSKSQDNPLPKLASYQNLKEMLAYAIQCLKTQGWIPDFYDWNDIANSRACLAPRTFVPKVEGTNAGAVPDSCWYVSGGRFLVGRSDADGRYSNSGMRGGVRIN